MALLDVGPRLHQALAPDDDPDADPAEAQRQQDALDLRLATQRVGDEEPEARQRREPEREQDETRGAALLATLVGAICGCVDRARHGTGVSGSSRSELRPANRAIRTSAVSPMTTEPTPSATGPTPPMGAPPGDGEDRR